MVVLGLLRTYGDIRPYDFQRPHQLSRLQLEAITVVTESYLRVAANFLTSYLRTPVQIQHVEVDQLPFDQFLESIRGTTVLAVFRQPPLPGTALLQCDQPVVLAMIDRALGGPGEGPYPNRELTEIERTIYRRMVDRLLDLLRQSWASLITFEPKVEAIEHNPALAQVAAETDLILVLRQQIQLDGVRGKMAWAWPYAGIQPLADALGRHGWDREEGSGTVVPQTEDMRRHVEATRVKAEVILGRVELTLGELARLHPGDVVLVETRYDQPLLLSVSDREKFQVLPGRHRGHLAVRVVGQWEERGHDQEGGAVDR